MTKMIPLAEAKKQFSAIIKRVGDCRIIYERTAHTISILTIKHRTRVY